MNSFDDFIREIISKLFEMCIYTRSFTLNVVASGVPTVTLKIVPVDEKTTKDVPFSELVERLNIDELYAGKGKNYLHIVSLKTPDRWGDSELVIEWLEGATWQMRLTSPKD